VLGERCALSLQSGATIGIGCLLGDEVVLIDFEPLASDPESAIRNLGLRKSPITIGDSTRIGPSAAILLGASIPSGAVVGAHENVTALEINALSCPTPDAQ
jgi:acetyltransferase-like isoleucine patch superfamily enzyme